MKLLLNIWEIYLGTVLFSLISHSQISFLTYQSKKQRAMFKWGLSENNCLHKGVRLVANLIKNFIHGGVKLKQSIWCEEGNLQFLPTNIFLFEDLSSWNYFFYFPLFSRQPNIPRIWRMMQKSIPHLQSPSLR